MGRRRGRGSPRGGRLHARPPRFPHRLRARATGARACRTAGRLKYLAGTEVGAGMFANDVTPEDAARVLQAVGVEVA